MSTPTTHYSFPQPTVGADDDAWGGELNTALQGIDAQMFANAGAAATATANAVAATASLLSMFVGMEGMWPASAAPAGWLALSGQLLARTSYAALWNFAQSSGNMAANDGAWTEGQFSPGDGSTTFRLPDMRGNFARAWDNGRGVDATRTIGSLQLADIGPHAHALNGGVGVSPYGNVGGTSGSGHLSPAAPAVTSTDLSAGSETRPRNIARLWCIFAGV